jgi:hypothetical protein
MWNKEELPEQWKKSIIVPIYKKGHKTECINTTAINFIQNFIEYPSLKVKSKYKWKYWGSSVCVTDVTDQLMITFSVFDTHWRENGSTIRQYISYS